MAIRHTPHDGKLGPPVTAGAQKLISNDPAQQQGMIAPRTVAFGGDMKAMVYGITTAGQTTLTASATLTVQAGGTITTGTGYHLAFTSAGGYTQNANQKAAAVLPDSGYWLVTSVGIL